MIIRLLSHQSLADLLWLCFLIGLLLHFWYQRNILMKARSWPKTPGMINHCTWTQDKNRIWPTIEYEYSVDGQTYQGEHLLLDTRHSLPTSAYAKNIAYRAAIAYQNQQAIDIYYNPQNPRQSALDVNIPRKLNVLLGLVGFLLAFHLFFIIFIH